LLRSLRLIGFGLYTERVNRAHGGFPAVFGDRADHCRRLRAVTLVTKPSPDGHYAVEVSAEGQARNIPRSTCSQGGSRPVEAQALLDRRQLFLARHLVILPGSADGRSLQE